MQACGHSRCIATCFYLKQPYLYTLQLCFFLQFSNTQFTGNLSFSHPLCHLIPCHSLQVAKFLWMLYMITTILLHNLSFHLYFSMLKPLTFLPSTLLIPYLFDSSSSPLSVRPFTFIMYSYLTSFI